MPGAVLYGASLGVFVGGMLRHHYSAFVSGGINKNPNDYQGPVERLKTDTRPQLPP